MNSSTPSWTKINQIDSVLISKSDRPIVKFSLVFPSGSFSDPNGHEGLTNFMGDLLLRGTKTRTRVQIEDQLDQLGASLNAYIGYHSLMIDGYCLKRNLNPLIELTKDIMFNPTFPEEEIAKLKTELYADIKLRLEDDQDLARHHFAKKVYQNNRYAKEVVGTLGSIETFTRDLIAQQYNSLIHAGGILFGASGDLDEQEFSHLVTSLTKDLPSSEAKKIVDTSIEPVKGRNIILVDKPARSQTQFFIGHPCIESTHKDMTALQCFINGFAGSIFQAKYMQEIRVKRGWSYGAYGSLDSKRDRGSFSLYTFPKTEDTLDAIALSLELFEQAVHGDLMDDQLLEFSKTYMLRSYPFKMDTPEKILSRKISDRLLGRDDSYLEGYMDRVSALTCQSMREAAKKHLDPANVWISVLCTANDLQTIDQRIVCNSKTTVAFDHDL
ncbi:MAG: pitrilysin family protein [Bdellovibrionota bacterium]